MSRTFTLPDLGEGLTEAEVVAWRVAVGDVVAADAVVAEVETAKASVEVPCPYPGRVVRLHGEPGDRLPVGAPLVTVEDAVGTAGGAAGGGRSGNVLVGFGTDGAAGGAGTTGGRRARRTARATAGAGEPSRSAGAVRCISPVVRNLARSRGIDLRTVTPTGPGGVVRRADVEAALAAAAPAPVAPAPDAAPAAEERIPLRGVRGAVAELVTRSRREVPDVTVWVDADASGLLAARAALSAAHPDAKVGILALLARICVAGLRRYPDLNARVDTDAGEVVRLRDVHLGFAAQTDRGLVVPVVRDAGGLTTLALAAALADATAAARAGTLAPQRLTGGTFTLNNYGVFGVDGSTPIVNHPQAALLGVGRIVDRPWAVDGQVAVRPVTQLSLTFDHRVCDGGVAGGFLRFVADCVEQPALLLAHV